MNVRRFAGQAGCVPGMVVTCYVLLAVAVVVIVLTLFKGPIHGNRRPDRGLL